ncbi:MAG: glycosyltransferase family 2 protein [Bdellovibrionales bacterium]|nr:glycosyltransferase family 2 protein [Bdellovibrionales bacterium]
MIDNGSSDSSAELCKGIVEKDGRWKYIRFSRNFGLESSFFAGINYATGDALVYLFSDLQDPPELIPEFLRKWELGYDIVYGRLIKRQDSNFLVSALVRIAHKVINNLSDVNLPTDAGDYRLLSRPVINAIKKMKERNRYMRGISHWVGFKVTSVDFSRVPRKSGKSSARLWLYFLYTLNAIISFSTKPIRLASMIGIFTMFMSFFGRYLICAHYNSDSFGYYSYSTATPLVGIPGDIDFLFWRNANVLYGYFG